jgi:hypothetical protein
METASTGPAPSGANLIVRVKRRRDEEVGADTLCVVEDEEAPRRKLQSAQTARGLISGMERVSTAAGTHSFSSISPEKSTSRLILTRVRTIQAQENLDMLTLQSASERKRKVSEDGTAAAPANNSAAPKKSILVTKSKKSMKSEVSGGNFVLVDMTQLSRSSAAGNVNINNQSNASSPTKVVDPATRRLEGAITTAYKTGDFTSVMTAMNSGANINFRTSPATGGRTILMCAAYHCNARMVKQLLARSVNIIQTDENGWTAMDYAQRSVVSSNKLESKIDIQQWIYRASIKQLQQHPNDGDNALVGDTQMTSQGFIGDDEYVYDIYCALSPEAEDAAKVVHTDDAQNSQENNAAVVSIDGLVFGAGGEVELAFEYDSDWSDLADDEDVDSNDERFEGNDYPEDDDQDEALYRRDRSEDSDEEDDEPRDDDNYDLNDEYPDSSSFGKGNRSRLPEFQNRSVGRVLKGGYIGGDGDGYGFVSKSKEYLQSLWGEENEGLEEEDADDEDDHGNDFRSRVANMRARTGMDFASNVREFDESGLAKYGDELIEDNDDMLVLESTLMQPEEKRRVSKLAASVNTYAADDDVHADIGQVRPNRGGAGFQDVAFDPEIDCSSEEES